MNQLQVATRDAIRLKELVVKVIHADYSCYGRIEYYSVPKGFKPSHMFPLGMKQGQVYLIADYSKEYFPIIGVQNVN